MFAGSFTFVEIAWGIRLYENFSMYSSLGTWIRQGNLLELVGFGLCGLSLIFLIIMSKQIASKITKE